LERYCSVLDGSCRDDGERRKNGEGELHFCGR
jgi:hypothetical protein